MQWIFALFCFFVLNSPKQPWLHNSFPVPAAIKDLLGLSKAPASRGRILCDSVRVLDIQWAPGQKSVDPGSVHSI